LGVFRNHPVRPSVRPSVRLSVRPCTLQAQLLLNR
jgi:hypothetical protein